MQVCGHIVVGKPRHCRLHKAVRNNIFRHLAIIEFIIEVFVKVVFSYVLAYPGAIFKWVFSDKKKSINQIFKQDNLLINASVGAIFIFSVGFTMFIIIENYIK